MQGEPQLLVAEPTLLSGQCGGPHHLVQLKLTLDGHPRNADISVMPVEELPEVYSIGWTNLDDECFSSLIPSEFHPEPVAAA
jgi:hypothetical protein